MPGVGLQDVAQRLLCAVESVTIVVIQPIILKQRLNFQQFGHDCVAHHHAVDDR
jgi:hypothetical protein